MADPVQVTVDGVVIAETRRINVQPDVPDELKVAHREKCIFQIVARCHKACRPAELGKCGTPIMRSEKRGGAGHHHLDQWAAK